MGLLSGLGAALKGAIGVAAHSIPGVSQLYDAFGAVAALTQNKTVGPVVSASIPMPVPSIFGSSGGAKVPGTSMVPALPPLGGGVIKTGVGGAAGSGPIQPGMHITKSGVVGAKGHYTKKGNWTNRRRPRMNVANVHALRRSVSRLKGAEKMFRKVLAVTHPGHKGKVKPKFGRKR